MTVLLALVNDRINDSSQQQDVTAKVDPDHQQDQTGDTAIKPCISVKVVDIPGKTNRKDDPA